MEAKSYPLLDARLEKKVRFVSFDTLRTHGGMISPDINAELFTGIDSTPKQTRATAHTSNTHRSPQTIDIDFESQDRDAQPSPMCGHSRSSLPHQQLALGEKGLPLAVKRSRSAGSIRTGFPLNGKPLRELPMISKQAGFPRAAGGYSRGMPRARSDLFTENRARGGGGEEPGQRDERCWSRESFSAQSDLSSVSEESLESNEDSASEIVIEGQALPQMPEVRILPPISEAAPMSRQQHLNITGLRLPQTSPLHSMDRPITPAPAPKLSVNFPSSISLPARVGVRRSTTDAGSRGLTPSPVPYMAMASHKVTPLKFFLESELHSSSVFSSTRYGSIVSAAQSTTLSCGGSVRMEELSEPAFSPVPLEEAAGQRMIETTE